MDITVGNTGALDGVRKIVRKMRGLAVGDMGESGGFARLLIEGVFCARSRVIASVFVKLLHFVFGGEAVRIGQLQIDFVDGVVVIPAADLLNQVLPDSRYRSLYSR